MFLNKLNLKKLRRGMGLGQIIGIIIVIVIASFILKIINNKMTLANKKAGDLTTELENSEGLAKKNEDKAVS